MHDRGKEADDHDRNHHSRELVQDAHRGRKRHEDRKDLRLELRTPTSAVEKGRTLDAAFFSGSRPRCRAGWPASRGTTSGFLSKRTARHLKRPPGRNSDATV